MKRRFLVAYEDTGSVVAACRMVRLARSTVYEWRAAARYPDPRLVAGVLGCLALTLGVVWFGRRRPGLESACSLLLISH